jgi:hypothetical protein
MRIAKPAYLTLVTTISVHVRSDTTPRMVGAWSPPVRSSTVLRV